MNIAGPGGSRFMQTPASHCRQGEVPRRLGIRTRLDNLLLSQGARRSELDRKSSRRFVGSRQAPARDFLRASR
jgi:hypothetical protein